MALNYIATTYHSMLISFRATRTRFGATYRSMLISTLSGLKPTLQAPTEACWVASELCPSVLVPRAAGYVEVGVDSFENWLRKPWSSVPPGFWGNGWGLIRKLSPMQVCSEPWKYVVFHLKIDSVSCGKLNNEKDPGRRIRPATAHTPLSRRGTSSSYLAQRERSRRHEPKAPPKKRTRMFKSSETTKKQTNKETGKTN